MNLNETTSILDAIKQKILLAKEIAIFSHIHPDGDTIGAQLGIFDVLQKLGVKTHLYNCSGAPPSFSFLAQLPQIKTYEPGMPLPTCILCLDCGSLARVGVPTGTFDSHDVIVIDHHAGNTEFGQINWVDEHSPATCEMVARMIEYWAAPISPDGATALYTGLSTDSGSFKYEQIRAETFETAAWLIRAGADHQAVRLHIYENQTRGKFQLTQKLYDDTKFMFDDQLATATILHEDLITFGVGDDEIHGMVSLMKEIEGVEVAVLFRTKADGSVKISLRSKSWLNVNAIATELGGGGHVRAAGATVALPLDDAVLKTHQLIKEALHVGDSQ